MVSGPLDSRGRTRSDRVHVDPVGDPHDPVEMAAAGRDVRRRMRPKRDDPGRVPVERPLDPGEDPHDRMIGSHVAPLDQCFRPQIADLEDERNAEAACQPPAGEGAEEMRAGADDDVRPRQVLHPLSAPDTPRERQHIADPLARVALVGRRAQPQEPHAFERLDPPHLFRPKPCLLARHVVETRRYQRHVVAPPVERLGKREVPRDAGLGWRILRTG